MVRISSFHATLLAWKSMECGSLFASGFTRVTRTVSPTLTRRTGPGTESPKLQTVCTIPGATVISCSLTTSSNSCRSPAGEIGRRRIARRVLRRIRIGLDRSIRRGVVAGP